MAGTEFLKNLIKVRYRSVAAFSRVTGIPQTTLSHILNHDLESASLGSIVKICDELGLSIDQLLSRPSSFDIQIVPCTKREVRIIERCRENDVLAQAAERVLGIDSTTD